MGNTYDYSLLRAIKSFEAKIPNQLIEHLG